MANEPVIGTRVIGGVKASDPTIPVRIVVDDSFSPPRLIVEIPSSALRDLGIVSADIITPGGDSAMDEANDAVRVNVVAGGAGDGSILDGVTSSIKASVLDYTNSNPVAVRLTDTNGDYVSPSGGAANPGTSALTSVVASASSVTLKAANASRLGLIIVNDSETAILYVKYGATASATSYTRRLLPHEELVIFGPTYTGVVDGIWDVASGNARVTELTA